MEFVIWLYRIGRLTPEAAMAVLDHHLMHRRPLGRVAVAEGMLDEQQVATILAAQARERPRARFGELALRLGFLGISDLEQVLAAQQGRDGLALPRAEGVEAEAQLQFRSRDPDGASQVRTGQPKTELQVPS